MVLHKAFVRKSRLNFSSLLVVLSITAVACFVLSYFSVQNEEVGSSKAVRKYSRQEGKSICDELRFEDMKQLGPFNKRVLDYVRCNHLVPPSSEPYVLSKSQVSRVQRELQIIFKNQTGGFFIECGANDGQFFSNTLDLEIEKNWTGLLIEADPVLGKQLIKKHRKAWFADICASPHNSVSEMEFLHTNAVLTDNADWKRAVAQLKMADGVQGTAGINNAVQIQGLEPAGSVKCFPLPTLLAALNIMHVDFLSLDVEGVELKVLKTLPFGNKLQIDFILVEYLHVPEGKDALRTFMESIGYRVNFETHFDFMFELNRTRKTP